jgi:hypothetical protein
MFETDDGLLFFGRDGKTYLAKFQFWCWGCWDWFVTEEKMELCYQRSVYPPYPS